MNSINTEIDAKISLMLTYGIVEADDRIKGTYTTKELSGMLGFLPIWVADGGIRGLDAQEALTRAYPFPTYEMDGEITDDGTYLYPEDPPLRPLATMRRSDEGETIYFYPHAMVGVVKANGDQWVTRMD